MEKAESGAVMVRKMMSKGHHFMVENYSARKLGVGVGEEMELGLEEFVVDGQRWGIRFFPEGVDDAAHTAGYASLYVTLKSAEPVEFMIALSIVDQRTGCKCGISSFRDQHIQRLTSRDDMNGRPLFIRRAVLDSDYVKKDCLKISVCIGVFTYDQMPRWLRPNHERIFLTFEERLQYDYDDEYIFFEVGDQITYCGARSIIAARAPLFLSLLPDARQRQDVVLPDIDPRVFRVLLLIIYKKSLPEVDKKTIHDSDPQDGESFVVKLLAAADRFKIKHVKKICEESISKKVCIESVIPLLTLAHIYNAAQLKSICLRFASENPSVLECDECEVIKETCPILFLELNGYGDNSSFQDNDPSTIRELLLEIDGKNNGAIINKMLLTMFSKVTSTVTDLSLISSRQLRWGSSCMKGKIKEF